MPEGTYPISESTNSFKNQQVNHHRHFDIQCRFFFTKMGNFGFSKNASRSRIYFRKKIKNKFKIKIGEERRPGHRIIFNKLIFLNLVNEINLFNMVPVVNLGAS